MAEIAVLVCQGYQQGAERQTAFKAAFKAHPKESKVRGELTDIHGRRKVFLREVYYFSDPYCRLRYSEGDQQELNRQEIKWRNGLTTVSG